MGQNPSLQHAQAELSSAIQPLLRSGRSQCWAAGGTLVLVDPPLPAALNMERDETLFRYMENVYPAAEASRQTLWDSFVFVRVYRWLRPAITLGRHQLAAETFLDMKRVAAAGIPVVRRITGGQAVLHVAELTYSVVASRRHPRLGGNIRASYEAIAAILLRFLAALGAAPNAAAAHFVQTQRRTAHICYDSIGWAEVTLGGKKLVGAAQRRGRYAFLQHGSLPLLHTGMTLSDWLLPQQIPQQRSNPHAVLSEITACAHAAHHAPQQLAQQLAQCFFETLTEPRPANC